MCFSLMSFLVNPLPVHQRHIVCRTRGPIDQSTKTETLMQGLKFYPEIGDTILNRKRKLKSKLLHINEKILEFLLFFYMYVTANHGLCQWKLLIL